MISILYLLALQINLHLKCRQHASLVGRNDLVMEGVERRFQDLMRAHQHRVTDSRSQTHLQVPQLLTIHRLEGFLGAPSC